MDNGRNEKPSRLRVAAVQAASVFLDSDATTAKAARLIEKAGSNGAELVAFPEGFLPGHPFWFHFHAATSAIARRLSLELVENSMEIPGPETDRLCEAARAAGSYVVVGLCERVHGTDGTLYNTQLCIGPDGAIVGKHRKIMPTLGERLVHARGGGEGLEPFATQFGPVSSLVCGENSNPLAVFALMARYPKIHVMSWPNMFGPATGKLADRACFISRAFANMAKCFVISACSVIDDSAIDKVRAGTEAEEFLRDSSVSGGSLIVAPGGSVMAGPLGSEETILYSDLDLRSVAAAKLAQDYAGHYNRPDIFELKVNRGERRLVTDVASRPMDVPSGSDHLGAPTPPRTSESAEAGS